jgi:hypothetical protein
LTGDGIPNRFLGEIAWIDIARESADNVLHIAAKRMPTDLIVDLKDVCVHHTQLPVTGCDVGFTRGRPDPLADLASEVRIWLRAIRFEVGDEVKTDHPSIDITATIGTRGPQATGSCALHRRRNHGNRRQRSK